MNAPTLVLLVVAGAFAIANWASLGRSTRTLEWATKPAVTALLVAAACTIDLRQAGVRPWFVAALVLSLIGDVLLMLEPQKFVGGLGSFLLAHIVYVVGFIAIGVHGPALEITAVAVVAVTAPVARMIMNGVRDRAPELRAPVALYMTVIATMVICAGGSELALGVIGAATFAFSDSLIAYTRFVQPRREAGVAIMITYHLGQLGILLSLAK